MILQKEIEVIPTGKIKYYYKELGYELHGKTPIFVKNEHLSDTSKVMEQRKCDSEECENIFFRPHKDMVKNFNKYGKDLCPECVEKERVKRIRETSLERYGVKNPMMAKEIQEKAKKTTLEHFGVEYPTQNKQVIELRTFNFLEKYGVENPQQVKQVKEKAKQTNLKKYGSENPFGSKEIQEKIRQTNLERYGAKNPQQVKEIKEKTEKTCLERYGFTTPLKNKEVQEKIKNSLLANGTVPTSNEQIKLYELCKEVFSNFQVKLNSPLFTLFLDIEIIDSKGNKIDMEYDGWFWHHLKKQKDRARDEVVKKYGYKIIRIKSAGNLPTNQQLLDAYLSVTELNHSFACITLEDWIKKESEYNNTLKTETKQ